MRTISIPLNLDQTNDQCIFPCREARTTTPPSFHRLSVASRAVRDPFQQLQHERVHFIHPPKYYLTGREIRCGWGAVALIGRLYKVGQVLCAALTALPLSRWPYEIIPRLGCAEPMAFIPPAATPLIQGSKLVASTVRRAARDQNSRRLLLHHTRMIKIIA